MAISVTNHSLFSDFEPIVIDNVFTEEEIKEIYESRLQSENFIVDDSCGYITNTKPFSEHIRNKIVEIVQKNVPIKVKEWGNHMPRYTLESNSKPRLHPHYDVGLDQASFTLSIQLDHTLPWTVYVGHQGYDIKRNSAVLFSGSHQIHWRPDIEFSKDDYYDVIVAQVVEDTENPLELSNAHREYMSDQVGFFVSKYFTSQSGN